MTLEQSREMDLTILSMAIPGVALVKLFRWAYIASGTKAVVGLLRLAYASKYGINSYRSLKGLNLYQKLGTHVHHLVEQRFANTLGQKADDMLSIVVTPGEHQVFTNAWKAEIAYEGSGAAVTTLNATKSQVEAAARKVYADYPEILKALGL